MLHAGLKLYSRIHGAVGNLDQTNHGTTTHSANTSARSSARSTMVDSPVASNGGAVDGNAELKNALTNLNLVMATCTLCILLQVRLSRHTFVVIVPNSCFLVLIDGYVDFELRYGLCQ